MARVTYGVFVTEINGSIGGITFQRNGSGTICRSRAKAVVNPSQLQSNQHTKLGSLVALWPTLTPTQQLSWHTLALSHYHTDPWGSTKQLSCFQQFMSNNLNLASLGLPPIINAPAYALPSPPTPFVVIFNAFQIILQFDDPSAYVYPFNVIFATPPLRSTSVKCRRNNNNIPLGTIVSVFHMDITDSYCNYYNISYPSLFASSLCNLIIRLRYIDPATGFSSIYTSAISRVGDAPAPVMLRFLNHAALVALYPDYALVSFWNTLFNLPADGCPFSSVTELVGNVTLSGSTAIDITSSILSTSADLLYIFDYSGVIKNIYASAFLNTQIKRFYLGGVLFIGDSAFSGASRLDHLIIPVCERLGSTTGLDNVFLGISGNTIELIIPQALMNCNGGDPDTDIIYLQANNTVAPIVV